MRNGQAERQGICNQLFLRRAIRRRPIPIVLADPSGGACFACWAVPLCSNLSALHCSGTAEATLNGGPFRVWQKGHGMA